MSHDHDAGLPEDGLTPEEREWMEQVPERVDPPSELRDRVLAALASAGEVRTGRGRGASAPRRRRLAVAAGLAAAFLAGGLAGRVTAPAAPGPGGGGDGGARAGPRGVIADAPDTASWYLLILYEDRSYSAPDRTRAQLEDEYRAWAMGLAAAGSLVMAEKLSDDARVVPFPGPAAAAPVVPATSPLVTGGAGVVTGFFIVRADSYDEAARLARESPHVGYGGRVVIRRIDAT